MLRYLLIIIIAGCNSVASNKVKTALTIHVKDEPGINSQLDSIVKIVEEGNIIFRGGTDIESSIIRDFSKQDKLFSHCGIIRKNSSQRFVVTHILGGTTNPEGGILDESIEQFLIYPQNESAGVYELELSDKELHKIYFFIDSMKDRNVIFDLRFNLYSKDKLYCTELLIDALCYAKNNSKLFDTTIYNLKNTKYHFLSRKTGKFEFYPVDKFQFSKNLKRKGIFLFPNYQSK